MAVEIRFENLTKTFGTTRAVDSMSLTIRPGELFFLLGPSGCGKTTLLRCLAGFHIPNAGTIYIDDIDITRVPPHLRDTGMVFQSYALWPHMSIWENVAFGLEMRKVPKPELRKRVDEALAMVKMEHRGAHKPNQLSGGQQQRVALARALVVQPKCLLLDEPLSNLDAKLRLEMRGEIRRICKESGLTAVYVTHDQKEALSIADRLAVLEDGCLRQAGKPAEVYHQPVSRFVANFIGETNFIEGVVSGICEGGYQVKTAIGVMEGRGAPDAFAVGASVLLSVRPETLMFTPPPAGAPNVFDAEVHDTVYLGEVAQHQVNLHAADNGEARIPLKAFELNPRILARDTVEKATAWFYPRDVVIIPPDPA